jgi:excisionase family DNA binding protein
MEASNQWVTAKELAIRLRVTPDTVKTWSREGRIPSVRVSAKVLRFNLAEVVAAIRAKGVSRG